MSPIFLAAAIESAAKALGFLVPLILLLAPVVLPPVLQNIDENQRRRLLAATKAAVLILSEVSTKTASTVDDRIVEVIQAVEKELGRSLKAGEERLVRSFAKTLHADPRFPARLTKD
jgi:hypothetical protein